MAGIGTPELSSAAGVSERETERADAFLPWDSSCVSQSPISATSFKSFNVNGVFYSKVLNWALRLILFGYVFPSRTRSSFMMIPHSTVTLYKSEKWYCISVAGLNHLQSWKIKIAKIVIGFRNIIEGEF